MTGARPRSIDQSAWIEVRGAAPGQGARGRSARPLLTLAAAMALAALAAVRGRPLSAVVVLVAGTLALQMSAIGWPPWERLVHAVGTAVGFVLRAVLLGGVFLVVVCPLWLVMRLTRYDPLAVNPEHGTWDRHKTAARAAPDRPFAPERRSIKVPTRLAMLTIAVVAVVAVGVVATNRTSSPEQGPRPITRRHSLVAHQDAPWARALFAEEASLRTLYDPYLTIRPDDHEGRYINIHDRVRRSYVPGTATDDATTVWFFGSSALFGIGQRDTHTIPSQIARLAEQDDIDLRVSNFGLSSYVNRQEVVLFAQELAARPAPDLVVFYDGANDVGVYTRQGATEDPSTVFARDVERALLDQGAVIGEPPATHDGRTDEERVPNFLRVYGEGAQLARWLGRGGDVPVLQFFQPSLGTKHPRSPDDLAAYGAIDVDPEADQQWWETVLRDGLPTGVVDLTASLDDVSRPVFFDQAHTNELGAQVVAEAMYRYVKPVLQQQTGIEEGGG